MANQLFNQLNQSNSSQTNMNLADMMKSSNPQALIQSLASQNPKVASILDEYSKSNMTAKDFFFSKASQMGLNPDLILSQLR